MAFLKGTAKQGLTLDREQSLSAVPVLNQLVTIRRDDEGGALLSLPRRRTSTVRLISRVFGMPPHKRIELDELGTYAVELCNGSNTVSEIISRFAEKFGLNRREAEVSIVSYLRTLAKRRIVIFAVPKKSG